MKPAARKAAETRRRAGGPTMTTQHTDQHTDTDTLQSPDVTPIPAASWQTTALDPRQRRRQPKRTTSRQIGQWLDTDGRLAAPRHGSGDLLVTDVAPLATAEESEIAYCESTQQLTAASKSAASCLIVPTADLDAFAEACPDKCLLPSDDPQAAFIGVMMRIRPQREQPAPVASRDATIAPTARIGANCSIGPHAVIGDDAAIGENTIIQAGVFVGPGARIGSDCIVHANAVIEADCRIGDRTILNANCVIGADGFGFRFEQGRYVRIPHTGRVLIGDDVEVGACTTIDRGMIDDTVIGSGTKLDNLVMIAHNCQLGQHNAAAGMVGMAGSVTTGDYVRFGGHSGIGGHLTIARGATIGAKAAVVGDVPEGATYHGIPASPASDALRQMTTLRKLPEMRRQLRDLQQTVDQLSAALAGDEASASQPIAKAA